MAASLVLDPALPALSLAFDHEVLFAGFEELWERKRGQRLVLSECRRADTTYAPGVRCVAAYHLTGTDPSGASVRTFGVLDVRPSGATHRLFPDDPELPALVTAADGDVMRQRLAALSADVTGLERIDACEVTPVRYKPGGRCVLRYDLRSEGRRVAVIGKLVAAGGEKLFTTLVALRDSSETTPAMPHVPRPLFYWPDLELVGQSAVMAPALTASALDGSSPSSETRRWMRSAGSGLAALHTAVTAGGPRRTLQDDARELQDCGGLVESLAPTVARRFDDAVTAISRYARGDHEPAPVPSHGALRTDQFLVDGDHGIVLLDLDGFCWANPARDTGNLLAYLDWRAIRRPQDAAPIDEARRAFLEGYSTIAPIPDSQWLAAFRAASMLKIAARRYRSLGFEEWKLVPTLLEAASETLPG